MCSVCASVQHLSGVNHCHCTGWNRGGSSDQRELVSNLRFADNIALPAEEEDDVQELVTRVSEASTKMLMCILPTLKLRFWVMVATNSTYRYTGSTDPSGRFRLSWWKHQ